MFVVAIGRCRLRPARLRRATPSPCRPRRLASKAQPLHSDWPLCAARVSSRVSCAGGDWRGGSGSALTRGVRSEDGPRGGAAAAQPAQPPCECRALPRGWARRLRSDRSLVSGRGGGGRGGRGAGRGTAAAAAPGLRGRGGGLPVAAARPSLCSLPSPAATVALRRRLAKGAPRAAPSPRQQGRSRRASALSPSPHVPSTPGSRLGPPRPLAGAPRGEAGTRCWAGHRSPPLSHRDAHGGSVVGAAGAPLSVRAAPCPQVRPGRAARGASGTA